MASEINPGRVTIKVLRADEKGEKISITLPMTIVSQKL